MKFAIFLLSFQLQRYTKSQKPQKLMAILFVEKCEKCHFVKYLP